MQGFSPFARAVFASTSSASSVRHLSSSAPLFLTKQKTLIELLQDIPNLGETGDRVYVKHGYSRVLVPCRKARIIPFARRFRIPPSRINEDPTTQSTKADPNHLLEAPGVRRTSSKTPIEPTPQTLLDSLHLIPETLTFPLRTVDSDPELLHGSLTLADIQTRLAEENGLTQTDVIVEWEDGDVNDRMKRVGTRDVVVSIRGKGGESVDAQVEVVSLGDEAE